MLPSSRAGASKPDDRDDAHGAGCEAPECRPQLLRPSSEEEDRDRAQSRGQGGSDARCEQDDYVHAGKASGRSGLGGVRFRPGQTHQRGTRGAQTHGRDDESRGLRGTRTNRARGETLPSLRAYRCDRQGEPDDDLWDRRAHLARGVSRRAGQDRRSRAGGHHPSTRRRSQGLRSRRASVGRRNHALRDVLLLPVTHRVPMLRI